MSYTSPLVSVLLPVYNGEPYLRGAIESILNQTYPNFELIILNDGSQDDSERIIASFADHPHIRVFFHPNRGLPATLNRGIELARGELIARMDQDDLAASERLSKQVEYLTSNTNVAVLGTSYRVIDSNGQVLGIRYQLCDPHQVRRQMFTGNPFCHGTVMFRKSTVVSVGCYNPVARIEDYDLWSRVFTSGSGEMANLKDVLYDYRVNVSTSMVATNRERYRHETDIIREFMWTNGAPPGVLEQKASLNSISDVLLPNGTHNRTERYLHLATGLTIAYALRDRRNRRSALREWFGLCKVHRRSALYLARLLWHLPSLLTPKLKVFSHL